jgi:hypothetical protein
VERGVPQGYHLDPVVHGTLADIYTFTEQAHRTLLVSGH